MATRIDAKRNAVHVTVRDGHAFDPSRDPVVEVFTSVCGMHLCIAEARDLLRVLQLTLSAFDRDQEAEGGA